MIAIFYLVLQILKLYSYVVIANVGSTGNAYRVPKYHLPMTLAPNMYLVRFNEDLMIDDFAYFVITDDGFQKRMHQNIASTTLKAINKSNFRHFP